MATLKSPSRTSAMASGDAATVALDSASPASAFSSSAGRLVADRSNGNSPDPSAFDHLKRRLARVCRDLERHDPLHQRMTARDFIQPAGRRERVPPTTSRKLSSQALAS